MAEPEDGSSGLVNTVLKAGAVAAALSSIIALVVTLVPDSESPEPPPRIAGKLSGLHVSAVGSLGDYGRRARPVPEECAQLRRSIAGTSTPTTSFASYAQAQTTTDQHPPPGDDGTGPGTGTETEARTDTQPGDTTTPDGAREREPAGKPELETDLRGRKLPFNRARQVAQALVPDAGFLQSIETSEPELMRRFIETAPGVRRAVDMPLTPVESKRLAAAVRGSVVDYRVRVEGRRGRCTVVRPSLIVFSTDPNLRREERDFRKTDPFFFVPESNDHEAIADLFVPRLRQGQPFQVTLRLSDETSELDRRHTKPF